MGIIFDCFDFIYRNESTIFGYQVFSNYICITNSMNSTNSTNYKNIVLTGFMGTGKSTVGRRLAKKLGRPFVDLDDLLEERQGRAIREIFEAEGEAHFRQLEADLCQEAAHWTRHVIATGGGALTFAHNLAAFVENSNLVICLDCEPEALWQRLSRSTHRPMLDSDDRKTRLLALLAERQSAYTKVPHHIDTTAGSIHNTVKEIMALCQNLGDNEDR